MMRPEHIIVSALPGRGQTTKKLTKLIPLGDLQ
jgi:hypothetical protein